MEASNIHDIQKDEVPEQQNGDAIVPPAQQASNEDERDYVAELAEKLANLSNAEIQGWCKELDEIDEEREQLNTKAKLVKTKAKKAGIAPGLLMAMRGRREMDDKKRQMQDLQTGKLADALGVTHQFKLPV